MRYNTWYRDVRILVDQLPKQFSLKDLYKNQGFLLNNHLKNNNIEAKIRQQLQVMRDKGLIQFYGNGRYEKIADYEELKEKV